MPKRSEPEENREDIEAAEQAADERTAFQNEIRSWLNNGQTEITLSREDYVRAFGPQAISDDGTVTEFSIDGVAVVCEE